MNNQQVNLGFAIRQLRERRNLTKLELAARAGVSRNYLRGIERGTRNVSLGVFMALAAALEVKPVALLQKL